MNLLSVIPFIHNILRQHIIAGDLVLDGTAGNGHDTLLLAQCVGDAGSVYAFDIQEQALHNTAERLQQHGVAQRVQLIHAGHERVAEFVPSGITAAVFNFGYLPHGDHAITTQTETSLQAVQAALSLLRDGGILCAVLYHGHEAGKPETAALLDYASGLSPQTFRVARYEWLNRHHAPIALLIEKL